MNGPSRLRCLAHPARLAGQEQANAGRPLARLRACGLATAARDGKRVRDALAHPMLKARLAPQEGSA